MASESGFQEMARSIVVKYFNDKKEKTDDFKLDYDDTYVVWFSKTLANWKALVSTTVVDGMYYEITHNGNSGETYLDAYKKFENKAYTPDELMAATLQAVATG